MKFTGLVTFGLLGLAAAFPSDYLKVASWDIEGYAKSNPIGKTTGGKGGPTVWATTAAELAAAVAGPEKKIVRVKGAITLPSRLKVGSNKSVIGSGWNTVITGAGIDIFNGDNVIVQNLKISKIVGGDGITIRNFTRVWVDHNEFESEFSAEIGPDYYVSSVYLIWMDHHSGVVGHQENGDEWGQGQVKQVSDPGIPRWSYPRTC
jgi:pectate lyase